MHAGPARPQQPDREFRVLGDAPLVPAAEFVQGNPPDEAHGAGEDRAVMLVARRLGDGEEVLVGVVQAAVVAGVAPVPVVLRCLHEADPRVGEQRHAVAQPLRLDLIVRVDDADDLGVRVGEVLKRVVERAGLVARPVLQVLERDAVPLAPGLNRPPERLIVGVVVDEDDLDPGVVKAQQRAERVDDHARRLVVRRDVHAHQRRGPALPGAALTGRSPPPAAPRWAPAAAGQAVRACGASAQCRARRRVPTGRRRTSARRPPQGTTAARRLPCFPGRGGWRRSTQARTPGRPRRDRCTTTSTGAPAATSSW